MKPRMYNREFKLMVVRQVEHGEKQPIQARREYGLANSVLTRWRNEYKARGEEAFTNKTSSTEINLETRVAELERLCGQLTLENTTLKKALRI